ASADHEQCADGVLRCLPSPGPGRAAVLPAAVAADRLRTRGALLQVPAAISPVPPAAVAFLAEWCVPRCPGLLRLAMATAVETSRARQNPHALPAVPSARRPWFRRFVTRPPRRLHGASPQPPHAARPGGRSPCAKSFVAS